MPSSRHAPRAASSHERRIAAGHDRPTPPPMSSPATGRGASRTETSMDAITPGLRGGASSRARWIGTVAVRLACGFGAMPAFVVGPVLLATGDAHAQVLDLGGATAGPKLPDATAAAELAKEMSAEATELEGGIAEGEDHGALLHHFRCSVKNDKRSFRSVVVISTFDLRREGCRGSR